MAPPRPPERGSGAGGDDFGPQARCVPAVPLGGVAVGTGNLGWKARNSSPSSSSALAAPTLASSPLAPRGGSLTPPDSPKAGAGVLAGERREGGCRRCAGEGVEARRCQRRRRTTTKKKKKAKAAAEFPLPLSLFQSSSSSSSSASSSSASLLSSLLPSPAPRHAPRWGVEVSHRGTLLLGGGGGGGARKSRRREEEGGRRRRGATASAAAAPAVSAPSPALLELLDSVLESYREDAKEKGRKGGKGGKEEREKKPPGAPSPL